MWALPGRSIANTAGIIAMITGAIALVIVFVAAVAGLVALAIGGLAVGFFCGGVLLGVGIIPDHGPHRRPMRARTRAAIDAAWQDGDRAGWLTAAAQQLRQATEEVEEVMKSTHGDSVLRRSLLTAAITKADTALTVVANLRDELAAGRGERGHSPSHDHDR